MEVFQPQQASGNCDKLNFSIKKQNKQKNQFKNKSLFLL